jgi:hypothetical protein
VCHAAALILMKINNLDDIKLSPHIVDRLSKDNKRRGESTYVIETVWGVQSTSIDGRLTVCGHTLRIEDNNQALEDREQSRVQSDATLRLTYINTKWSFELLWSVCRQVILIESWASFLFLRFPKTDKSNHG